jgi:hypothetical protein
MARFITLFLFALFFTGSFSYQALAQQQDDEASLLPEIDPQDIEIRSQFQARFPGIRRQPILGFDPTPRVYQVDPNRMPFMETQEQVVANLPVSELSRPDPPAYNPLRYSDDIQAYGRLGFGTFSSPIANFWGVHRLSEKSYVGGNLDFSSSEGHLDNAPSSFRFFNATGQYASKLNPKTVLNVDFGGQSDFHYLYPLQNQSPPAVPDTKNYLGFHLNGKVDQFGSAVKGWSAEAGVRYFDVALQDESLTGDVNETVYNGSFAKRWAGSHTNETFTLKGGVQSGAYGSGSNQDGWTILQGGARYQRLFNYNTQVSAEANVYYATDVVESKVYFGPEVEVEHSFTEALKIRGRAEGKPFQETIRRHHEENRFLTGNNILRHSYLIRVTGEAFLEYFRGSTLHGGIQYANTKNYAYYTQRNDVSASSYYQINYERATNFKIYAGVTHQLLPERFWVSGSIYAQNPKLDGGDRIPFEETWGLNASVHISPVKRIIVEGWLDYVGKRETGTTNTDLDAILLLGAQADLEITERFGAYIKGVNLLDDSYQLWEGYRERPFQIYGGITVKL